MTSVSRGGKRAGSRKGPKKRSLPSRKLLLLCLGVTAAVVAWGYLVYAAIAFGSAARGGERNGWIYLGLACVGAAGCLFVGLMLCARILRELGIVGDPTPLSPDEFGPTRTTEEEPDEHDDHDDRLAGTTPTLTVSPVVEVVPHGRHAGASPAPAAPAPTDSTTEAADADSGGLAPGARTNHHPRGKRVAEKGHRPDGPRQSGGRRIAR